jgi:filamentous hemagglutinin family protein
MYFKHPHTTVLSIKNISCFSASCVVAFFLFSDAAYSNPVLTNVESGNVTVTQSTNSTVVNQSSQQAIINWNSFNIAAGEKTQFVQPNVSSVALNRINPAQGASQIYGSLRSNGQIILINGAGIHFGPNAMVNVGGMIASTSDISNANFLSGKYIFDKPSVLGGSIINEGTLIAEHHGLIALLGTNVQNNGMIQAELGSVVLGSGNKFTLDFYGDQLINFSVDEPASAGGKIKNTGTLLADGGKVLVTAAAAQNVLDNTIDMAGIAQAHAVDEQDGEIILSSESGNINVSGTLDASGVTKGNLGGTIKVLGETVHLASTAHVNVNGDAGGGVILVGGNFHGSGPEKNALMTTVDAGALLQANALTAGNGGQIAVWSDYLTEFHGVISATGGSQSGNGGYVETSGGYLDVSNANINLSALHGAKGTWLLDPTDIFIADTQSDATAAGMTTTDNSANSVSGVSPESFYAAGSVADSLLTTGSLEAALLTSNVIVTTTNGAGTGTGNITVVDSINWTSGTSLTLSAFANINVNASISNSASGAGLVLRADNTGTGVGTINFAGAGSVSLPGGTASFYYNPSSFDAPTDFSGNVIASTFIPHMLINSLGTEADAPSANSLGALSNNSALWSYNFALGNNIEALDTASWNGGAGFSPIGNAGTNFTGAFDGQNFTINYLFSTQNGMFGTTGNSAVIQNLGLTNANISISNASLRDYGILVGTNAAYISNSYTTGSIVNNESSGKSMNIGGLVGYNSGTIMNDHSSAYVSNFDINGNEDFGGLVGTNNYGGILSSSYATGNILNHDYGSGSEAFGGLAGFTYVDISNVYSTGSVTNINPNGNGSSRFGGLVGWTYGGMLSNAYSTGNVTNADSNGSEHFGGLVGQSYGQITTSYSTGAVINTDTGTPSEMFGGFIGSGSSGVTNSFLDIKTSGQGNGTACGDTDNCAGVTGGSFDGSVGENLSLLSTYAAGGWSTSSGASGSITATPSTTAIAPQYTWFIFDGQTRPVLLSEEFPADSVTGVPTGAAPLAIQNSHQLQLVGSTLGANYTLANNIDMTTALTNTGDIWGTNSYTAQGSGFVPIGSDSASFTGNFNGAGYTIDSLYIHRPSLDAVGLFGVINLNTNTIENVGLTNAAIYGAGTPSSSVGGIVGNMNSGTLDNVYVTGSVTQDPAAGCGGCGVGGIVGQLSGGTLKNSYNAAAVSGNSSVGGLVGFNNGLIADSYNIGAVIATGNNLGGLVGYNNATITDTYSSGLVTGAGGGLVGYQGGTVTNSFWDTGTSNHNNAVTGGNSSDITAGTFDGSSGVNLSAASTYSNWNILSASSSAPSSYTWFIADGSTRPLLISEEFLNNNAYAIQNGHQLELINANLNGNYTLGVNVDLTRGMNNLADIWDTNQAAVTGAGFAVIGSYGSTFTGSFDGYNHVINDLYIDQTAINNGVALFGFASGTISNVGLTNVNVTGAINVAGLVGEYEGAGISNSYVTGSVTDTLLGSGGLVGALHGGTINTSYSSASVQSTNVSGGDNVGGLVGSMWGGATINNSYSTGSVTALGSGNSLGGFVGDLNSRNSGGANLINMSYSSGAVSGIGNVGGFVGVIGNSQGAGLVNNSFWDTDTSGQSGDAAAGIGTTGGCFTGSCINGGTVALNSASTYSGAGWSIGTALSQNNPWVIIDNYTRPLLTMEYNTQITNVHQLELISLAPTGNYTLANNIDASRTSNTADIGGTNGFIAIDANSSNGFSGQFNGNYHIINNPYMNSSGNFSAGFANTNNGIIENLGITSANFQFQNIYNAGILTANNNGLITNSFVTGSLIDSGAYVGPLAGGSGGIINNSYADVYVNASGDGGLVGLARDGAIINSYSAGFVTGYGNAFVFQAGADIINSYYDASTAGESDGSNATGLTTAQLMQKSNLVGFDFTNTWAILPGVSYPYLAGFYPSTPRAISGSTDAGGGAAVQLQANGVSSGATITGANGFYYYLAANGAIPDVNASGQSSYLTAYLANGAVGASITQLAGINQSLANFNVNTNTLTVGGSNTSAYSNTLLGMLQSPVLSLLYSVSGNDLTLGNNISFATGAGAIYTIDGAITGPFGGRGAPVVQGSLTFNGPVLLNVDTELDAGINPITFASTIDSASGSNHSLTLSTSGAQSLLGSVGSITPLSSLAIVGSGQATISSPEIITEGDQVYVPATTLGITNVSTQSLSGNIEFDDSISWLTANNLTITAANNIYLNGSVEAPLGGLTLSAVNNGLQSIGAGAIGSTPSLFSQNININNFVLEQGIWIQETPSPTLFSVANNFEIAAGTAYNNAFNAQFIRLDTSSSSNGIDDVYSLQGIATGDLTANYILTQNIDAGVTAGWVNGFAPIGNGTNKFTGDFQGNKFNVVGLSINGIATNGNTTGNNLGLFGNTSSTATIEGVGLIAENITATLNDANVGGLVGYNEGTINDVYTTGSITSGGDGSGIETFGGLVGTNAATGMISNAYSTSVLSVDAESGASTDYIGGFVGNNLAGGTIQETYSAGPITATSGGSFSGSFVQGGFAAANTGTVTDSYYDGQTSGQGTHSAAGTPETTADMMQQTTFSGYDFVNTWGIASGSSYPYLQGFAIGGGAPLAISGSVPTGDSGSLINLIDNGTFLTSTHAGPSRYLFILGSGAFSGNDTLLIYFSGASDYSNAIDSMNATPSSLSGVNLLSNTVSIYGSSMSNTLLANAAVGTSSDDILYTTSSNGTGYDVTLGNGTHADVNLVAAAAPYTLDGSITNTSGISNVTFNGAVTLGVSPTINVPTGSIAFNSTIDGSYDLTLTSLHNVLKANVGDVNAINSLTLMGGGTDEIDASSITTSGYQNYSDALLLGNSHLTLTANSTNGPAAPGYSYSFAPITINFNSTVDSTSNGLTNLTLISPSSFTNYNINADIGDVHPLASLIALDNGITVSGNITTTGDQNYMLIDVSNPNLTTTNNDLSFTANNITTTSGFQVDFGGSGNLNNIIFNLTGTNSEVDGTIGYQFNNFIQNGGYLTVTASSNIPIQVNSGTLNYTSASASYQPQVTIESGGTLNLSNVELLFQGLTLNGQNGLDTLTASGNSTIINGEFIMNLAGVNIGVAANSSLTINQLFSADTLTVDGAGTLVLGQSTNYVSNGINLNAGILSVTNSGALGTAPVTVNTGTILQIDGTASNVDVFGTPIVLNGGTLQGIGTAAIDGSTIALNTDSTILAPGASDTLAIGSTIDSANPAMPSSLTLGGTGSITLSGDIGATNPLQNLTANATTAITLNNNAITTIGNQTYNNDVNVTSSPTLTANNITLGNVIGNGGNLGIATTGNNSVISGTLSNTSLGITGGGYLTLSGDNSGTSLSIGLSDSTLHLTSTTRLGDQGTFSLTAFSGELLLDNANIDVFNIVNSNTIGWYGLHVVSTGNSSLNTNTLFLNTGTDITVTDGTFNLAASLQPHRGGGSIIKDGAGTLVLSNPTNRLNGITINNGIVSVSDTGALGGSSAITVNVGGDLNLNNIDLDSTLLTLSGTGVAGEGALTATGIASVTNSAITLSADAMISAPTVNDSLTIANTIDGPGGLSLQGLGTIALSAPIGSIVPIDSLTVGVGTFDLNNSSITTVNNQTYSDPLILIGDASLTSIGSGNISINNGVSGAGYNLLLTGGTGNMFTLGGSLVLNSIQITGGSGQNTLSIQNTSPQNWNISGVDQGSVTGNSGVASGLLFNNIQNLIGTTSGANDFIFSDGAILSGAITGGNTVSGNTIDFSMYVPSITASLSADGAGALLNSDQFVLGGFSQIHNLVGQNSLLSAGHASILKTTSTKANTITLTGVGSGYVNDPVNFSGFGAFTGGGNNNTFIIAIGNSYNPITNTVTVNGVTMSLSNIQIVQGGNLGQQSAPSPALAPAPSSAPASSSSSSSSSNATATQAVVSASYNQPSSSSSNSSNSNTSTGGSSSNNTAVNGTLVVGLVVAPMVRLVIGNMQAISDQQQAMDITINSGQAFGTCGG